MVEQFPSLYKHLGMPLNTHEKWKHNTTVVTWANKSNAPMEAGIYMPKDSYLSREGKRQDWEEPENLFFIWKAEDISL